jgi:glycerol-3-phosphate acyltransferase PlsY
MNNPNLILILILFASYLIGSFPTSILMGRFLKGIDIREHGSGNAGGTNVFRVLGWKPALIVITFDIFKGWFPTFYLAKLFFEFTSLPDLGLFQILCGFCAVLGHTYTIFAGFKGGKGVGTLAGLLIALFPLAVPLCILVFAITLIFTGYVSIGSIMASASLPIILLLLPLLGIEPAQLSVLIFSLMVPFFVIYTHRSNISRLRNDEENQFEKAMIFKKKN